LWCVLYPLAGGARGRLGNGHALVGKARIVILDDMDDAAPREAGLRQEILHHRVVGVRVDAEMPALRERPFDAGASNAPDAAGAGQPMHHAVWTRVAPGALFNCAIGRFGVRAHAEAERSDDPPSGAADITFS